MKKSKTIPANNKPGSPKPPPVTNTVKPAPRKRNIWVIVLWALIPVCALSIYGKTLNYPLDKLDEHPIFANMEVFSSTHPSIWDGVYVDAFFGVTKSDVFFYRPIQNVTYLFDVHLWGPDPFGVHLTNLLLFIGIAYAFLYLLTLFGVDTLLASVIALLLCCHPLYAIAVIWVPSRGDLLSTLFSLLSLAFFIKYYNGRKSSSFAGSVIFFFLAVFSKESVVGLPVLFILYPFIKDKAFYKSKQNLRIIFSLIGVSLLYLVVRQVMSLSAPEGEHLFNIGNFFANLRAIPEAVAKTIIPVSLSPMPSYSALPTFLGLILIVAFGAVIYQFRKNLPYLIFGIVWFLLFLAPTLFFQHRFAIHSYKYLEHRILLPSLGLLLIVALVTQYFLSKFRKAILISGGVIIIIFIGYSASYADIFETQFSFYYRVLAVDPDNILAHSNIANSYFNIKKYDSAIYHTSEAIKVYPHFTLALENRSKIYTQLNFPQKALDDLDTLVNIDTANFLYFSMKGNAENTLGKYQDALSDFNRSLTFQPNNSDVFTNKGTVLDRLNMKDSALIYYKKAMQLNPGIPWPFINAGLLESGRQNYPAAIDYYNKALQAKPDYWDIYLNRGIAWYYLKDYNKAQADYNEYLSKVPNSALALNDLGILKINIGQTKEGCDCLRKAAANGSADAAANVKIYCK